jgi:hypothetical protein
MGSENSPFIQSLAGYSSSAAERPTSLKPALKYTYRMITSDGQEVDIRPIKPEDKNKLQDFHTRLSEESLYLRYQYFKGALSDNDLTAFCNVDYNNTLGLVAEIEKDG